MQPSTLQRPPTHYGHGFGFRGPPPGEAAVGPAVDIEQLGKDIERAQVGLHTGMHNVLPGRACCSCSDMG